MDIKRGNILTASGKENSVEGTHPDDLKLEASDTNQSPCQCRLIDFELSQKTNYVPECIEVSYGSYLQCLIQNLPYGASIGENYE